MTQPDYLISTPENVDLHLELAGIGNRIYACCIDTLLTYGTILALGVASLLIVYALRQLPLSTQEVTFATYSVGGLSVVASLAVFFGFHIYFESTCKGQTPGKRLARIRVIDQTGQSVTLPSVWIRNLLRVADTGLALIGLVFMLADRNERRIGDFAAGTVVIKERRAASPDPHSKPAAGQSAFIDAGRITPQEYELIQSFLERRHCLSRSQRPLLARNLEHYFRTKLEEEPKGESAERFLETIQDAYLARAQQSGES